MFFFYSAESVWNTETRLIIIRYISDYLSPIVDDYHRRTQKRVMRHKVLKEQIGTNWLAVRRGNLSCVASGYRGTRDPGSEESIES